MSRAADITNTLGATALLFASSALVPVDNNYDATLVPYMKPNKTFQKQVNSCGDRYFSHEQFASAYPSINIIAPDIANKRQEVSVFETVSDETQDKMVDSYIKGNIYQGLMDVANLPTEGINTYIKRQSENLSRRYTGVGESGFHILSSMVQNGKKVYFATQHYGPKKVDDSEELNHSTSWPRESYELTGSVLNSEQQTCSVAHHEMGHAVYNLYGIETNGRSPGYIPGGYSSFVHENIAEVNRVLQMAKEGVDKDAYIDYRSMNRSYEAIKFKDGDHFASPSIQALKNVPMDKINDMSVEALAEYAISFTLTGDDEHGIDPPIYTKDEFDKMQTMLNGNDRYANSLKRHLSVASIKHFNQKEPDIMPTPRQVEYMLEHSPDIFTEQEQKFLTENIVPYKGLLITAMDAAHNLVDDPKADELLANTRKILYKTPAIEDAIPEDIKLNIPVNQQSPEEQFYTEVQERVWPHKVNGQPMDDVPPEFRKKQLDTYQQRLNDGMLDLGTVSYEDAQKSLDKHRYELKWLQSYRDKYGALEQEVLENVGEDKINITPEKFSKRELVKAYNNFVNRAGSISGKIHKNKQFARQFTESGDVPLPLDSTLEDVHNFLANEKESMELKLQQREAASLEYKRTHGGEGQPPLIIVHENKNPR